MPLVQKTPSVGAPPELFSRKPHPDLQFVPLLRRISSATCGGFPHGIFVKNRNVHNTQPAARLADSAEEPSAEHGGPSAAGMALLMRSLLPRTLGRIRLFLHRADRPPLPWV